MAVATFDGDFSFSPAPSGWAMRDPQWARVGHENETLNIVKPCQCGTPELDSFVVFWTT